MYTSLISPRIALRVLCVTLMIMALLDVPVAIGSDAAKWLGPVLLAGVIGALAALASRRIGREDPRGRAARGGRKGNLAATATR
jgi:hypothetical protein